MDKKRISYLLQKLRSHEATPGERNELESFWRWAQNNDAVINALTDEERQAIKEEMFDGIRARITDLESSRKARRGHYSSRVMLKIAASVALIIVLAGLFYPENRETVRADYGERLALTLPDNSTVVLNGNSTIRYDPSWGADDDREVWIEGEAFFDVTHTENDAKFIVHTGDAVDVEVLGTRFNVKIRRGKTEVMLEEGKVLLDISRIFSNETLTLRPGELGMLEDDEVIVGMVNPSEYSAWKDNRLYFDETTLLEVGHMLEDTYGLQVAFEDDSLTSRKLSGQITARSVNDILLAIAETFDIRVSEQGRKVTFQSSK